MVNRACAAVTAGDQVGVCVPVLGELWARAEAGGPDGWFDRAARLRRGLHELRLSVGGVEEYRFQKRTNGDATAIPDGRVAALDGLFFVNLDDWLGPDEPARLAEFRASDRYVAGRTLAYEVVGG